MKILNLKKWLQDVDWSSTVLMAVILLSLIFHSLSCIDSEDDQQSDDFALSENDYSLDCNASGDSEDALACQLAYHTNRQRYANPEESDHADPLDWSDNLAEVGRDYSRKMCDENFFDHADSKGRGMESRLQEAGVFYVKAGENLARGTDLQPSEAMSMYMDEPPCQPNHRGNVLDKNFTHTGVGVIFCGSKTIYTQLFATFESEHISDDMNEFCLSR